MRQRRARVGRYVVSGPREVTEVNPTCGAARHVSFRVHPRDPGACRRRGVRGPRTNGGGWEWWTAGQWAARASRPFGADGRGDRGVRRPARNRGDPRGPAFGGRRRPTRRNDKKPKTKLHDTYHMQYRMSKSDSSDLKKKSSYYRAVK